MATGDHDQVQPVTTGKVTHSIAEVEARTLGRFPGIGVAFDEPVAALVIYLL